MKWQVQRIRTHAASPNSMPSSPSDANSPLRGEADHVLEPVCVILCNDLACTEIGRKYLEMNEMLLREMACRKIATIPEGVGE